MKLILAFLFCLNVHGHGANPSGANVKLLKDNLRFKTTDTKIMTADSDDPSSVAKDAEIGSLYIRGGTGVLYQKTDSGSSTNWTALVTGVSGTGTDTCVARWNGTGASAIEDSLVCITDLGVMTGATQLTVDSLDLNGDVISSSGNIVITPTGTVKLSTLTATRPLKLNATNDIISTQIDLASTNDITGILGSANGGTGLDTSSATNGQLLVGNGSGQVLNTLTGTANQSIVTNGVGTITLSTPQDIHTGASPTFVGGTFSGLAASSIVKTTAGSVLTTGSVDLTSDITGLLPAANGGTGLDGSLAGNGVLLIGNGSGQVLSTLTGTANQVVVTNGAGTVTLSTPQNIHTGASPTFLGATISGLAASSLVKTTAGSALTTGTASLTSDVSGILPNANGGTGVSMAAYTQGSVLFLDASKNVVEDNANLIWDDAGDKLTTNNFRIKGDMEFIEVVAPVSPAATYHKLYFKSNDHLYMKNSAGTEERMRKAISPVITQYAGGSGTHNITSGVLWIRVRVIGGGGGGSGCGTSGSLNGGAGIDSTFGAATGGGGGAGVLGGFAGSGSASGGNVNLLGRRGQGQSGGQNVYGPNGANSVLGPGGAGGVNGFGGGSPGFYGGGGGAAGTSSSGQATGSGGSGGYVELIVQSPAGSYSYAVGAGGGGGTGGVGGNPGGAGGTGLIIVEEFF